VAAAPLKGVIVGVVRVDPLVGAWGCPSEMMETMTTDDGVALDIMALLDIMAVVVGTTTGTVVVMVVDAIGVVVIIGVVVAGAALEDAVVGPTADGLGMIRVTSAVRQRVFAN